MFFSKPINNDRTSGIVGDFPESPVNPLYKPKTLSELKALCVHTGINPSPVELRPAVPETDRMDAMDSPPIPVFADTFDAIRTAKSIKSEIEDLETRLTEEASAQAASPAQASSPALVDSSADK